MKKVTICQIKNKGLSFDNIFKNKQLNIRQL